MGTRILVVDDDVATVEMLTLALEMEGYEVVSASRGGQAMALVMTEDPDVVVCDVMMPGMTGLDVVKGLRDDPRTAETPVLLLSAWARDTDIWSGWMAGADAYVTKPMEVDDLVVEIERLATSGRGKLAV